MRQQRVRSTVGGMPLVFALGRPDCLLYAGDALIVITTMDGGIEGPRNPYACL